MLTKPRCNVRAYHGPFEEFIIYLTGEMKEDSVAAEGKANEAFSMLIDEDLDYDRLKSFTSHQLKSVSYTHLTLPTKRIV